jgi:hypothetical protein
MNFVMHKAHDGCQYDRYIYRCLLVSVTNYGCVLVQVPRMKQWLTVADISSLWTKYCSQNWGESGGDSKSISVLQSRAEKLKATGQLCVILTDKFICTKQLFCPRFSAGRNMFIWKQLVHIIL